MDIPKGMRTLTIDEVERSYEYHHGRHSHAPGFYTVRRPEMERDEYAVMWDPGYWPGKDDECDPPEA